MKNWFLISEDTVKELKACIEAIRHAALYQDTQRDREATLDKIKIFEYALDSGLHTCNVAPTDYQEDEIPQDLVTCDEVTIERVPDLQEATKMIDATIRFARVNIVDDDVDVMNEIMERLAATKELLT